MNIFIERHQQFLKELLDAQVEFILIGGYAVIYYGYRRGTGRLKDKADVEELQKIQKYKK